MNLFNTLSMNEQEEFKKELAQQPPPFEIPEMLPGESVSNATFRDESGNIYFKLIKTRLDDSFEPTYYIARVPPKDTDITMLPTKEFSLVRPGVFSMR